MRETGMPVQAATELSRCPPRNLLVQQAATRGFRCRAFSVAASFFCSSGNLPYWILRARFSRCGAGPGLQLQLGLLRSGWLTMLTALMAVLLVLPLRFEPFGLLLRLAGSFSSFFRRSRGAFVLLLFSALFARFRAAGFALQLVDLRGHGRPTPCAGARRPRQSGQLPCPAEKRSRC